MKFEEVLPALRVGKKIRRKDWQSYEYIKKSSLHLFREIVEVIVDEDDNEYTLTLDDFTCDDWQIVKEKKKVKLRDLTEEQFNKWFKNNCPKYDDYCRGCPFKKVKCVNREKKNDGWYLNKDLYSDKFLDQEIEIEEN